MIQLSAPLPGASAAHQFVANYLGHLVADRQDGAPSPVFRGGKEAAESALGAFDICGYAASRHQSYPQTKRASSRLSPWVRHGILSLQQLWDTVADGPEEDVVAFRRELLWQEYARHWYARLGASTRRPTRHLTPPATQNPLQWDDRMGCIEATTDELEEDGWLVNQSRMWLASHWYVRHGHMWQAGEDYFFRHLLDGSRAANRLGWQWVTGAGSSKRYGFSRWQVEKWAAGLCASCELAADCPIEEWPLEESLEPVDNDPGLRSDPDVFRTAGVSVAEATGVAEAVWITAESMGDHDPAMKANPDLPVIFVFDEPLLGRLQLSTKRLVFLVETLADLATRRELELWLGSPVNVLSSRALAATFTPVPGWRRRRGSLDIVQLYPWPWLVAPSAGSIASFSSWSKSVDLASLNVDDLTLAPMANSHPE